jgi:hypothetical protein
MAVAADDLALLDLEQDVFPRARGERTADRELLVAKMVELEHNRVGLAAVDAGVRGKVCEEIASALELQLALEPACLGDVLCTVREVVLPSIAGLAVSAMMLALPLVPPMPREIR